MAQAKTTGKTKGPARTQASKGKPSLGDQLRQAIKDSGLSVYAVAKGSGLSQASTQRFVTKERDLYLDSATRLAHFFGMELTAPRIKS